MGSVNKVILVGNLGKDPEVRHLEGGATVANFPIATSDVFKDKSGNKIEHTEWHNIVLWRGLAETAEKYLKKGNQVYIEGRIKTRTWEDKEGNKRYSTEVVGETMTLLGRPTGEGHSHPAPGEAKQEHVDATPVSHGNTTDDLPF